MDKLQIAMLGRLPKEQVKEIIDSLPEEEREELALSPDLDLCGEVCYEVLAEDENKWVRIELTKNKNLVRYPKVIKKLSEDRDEEVREYLAKNPEVVNKYPDIVYRLSEDRDEEVREYLALNSWIGMYPEIMKKLARDEFKWVRKAICTRDRLKEECPECIEICKGYGF